MHPDSRAIFYEATTYSKRKILDLLSTLHGFEKSQELPAVFSSKFDSLYWMCYKLNVLLFIYRLQNTIVKKDNTI